MTQFLQKKQLKFLFIAYLQYKKKDSGGSGVEEPKIKISSYNKIIITPAIVKKIELGVK